MRRNRKREPLRFGTVAKALITCVSISAIGVGYVYQKNQIYRLGDEITKREKALRDSVKRTTMLETQLARLTSPADLETKCQQYALGLVAPKETQTIRLLEPGPEWDTRLLPEVQTLKSAAQNQPVKTHVHKPVIKVASAR